MKNKFVLSLFAIFLAGILSYSFFWDASNPTLENTSLAPVAEGVISGFAATELYFSSTNGAKTVYLPDVDVIVRNLNQVEINRTTTDVDGSYRTAPLPLGTYLLCMEKNGYQNICAQVDATYSENYPGLQIIPLNGDNFIYGTALLRDGKPGYYRQEYFGIDFHTTITSTINSQTFRCNTKGEYVLPFQATSTASIKAKCQSAVVNKTVYPGQNTKHLILPNTSPVVGEIVITEAGNQVHRSLPGKNLVLQGDVSDVDAQPLVYKWFPWGDHPGFVSSNSNTVNWQLPTVEGTYAMYLVVNDKFGGIGLIKKYIRAVDRKVLFSGTVTALGSNLPIADARVDVNGIITTTNANGFFGLKVSESNGRYILNIEKEGLMGTSKIYFRDATSISYKLAPNTTGIFPSNEGILLIEREDEYTKFTRMGPTGEQISRPPAMVSIPPNAVMDENGQPFNGNILASLRAIDLFDENDLMPGDYGATQNGEDKTLESFGAIDVQLRDSQNPSRKLKLNPDMEAQIKIPISSAMEASAKETIDLWDYDTKEGVWVFIGNLQKQGNYYVGVTNMFSTLNADVTFTDASCLEIRDNPLASLFPGPSVTLNFQIPTLSGTPKLLSRTVNQVDLPLFVSRLPPFSNVVMEIIQGLDTRTQVIYTGPPNPGTANIYPSTGDCKIIYLDAPLESTPSFAFLNRVSNNATQADDYYKLIGALDGGGVPNYDLVQWKDDNEFDLGDDASALYYNAGDLGFWRSMHVKEHPTNNTISFYVTNYNTDLDALGSTGAIATVCMEYSPITGSGNPDPITKFLVFDGANNLVNNADLDDGGAKFIPGLCVVCHGGAQADYSAFADADAFVTHFSTTNPTDMPNFLHFDVESFAYSTQTGYLRSDQEVELRALNQNVMSVRNTAAIVEFVKTAYGAADVDPNIPLPASNFIDHSVVPDWDDLATQGGITHKDFYPEVVGSSCRVCHSTRSNSSIWFNTKTSFNSVGPEFAVCGNYNPYMPNALITFKNFWTDATRVATFRDYLGLDAVTCEDPN